MGSEVVGSGVASAVAAASTDILADDAVVSNPAEVAANTVIDPVVENATVPEVAAVKADKPNKKKKAKAKKKVAVKVAKKGKSPGRPPVFVGKVKTEITRLIRKHGITGTRDILAAKKGELAEHRNAEIVPKPLSISLPTLVKLGQKAGITLKRGRRAA